MGPSRYRIVLRGRPNERFQTALSRGMHARAYDVPSSGTAGAAFCGTRTPGTARIVGAGGNRADRARVRMQIIWFWAHPVWQ